MHNAIRGMIFLFLSCIGWGCIEVGLSLRFGYWGMLVAIIHWRYLVYGLTAIDKQRG